VSPPVATVGDFLAQLSRIQEESRSTFEPLSEAQFNWRPAPGKWSIGECFEHLTIATGLMLAQAWPALDQARAQGKLGSGPFDYGWIGGWFVRAMERPGKRAMPAPRNFAPASGLPMSQVIARFNSVMRDLRDAIEQSHGIALDKVKARSAAEGGRFLRLNLAAWFAATLAHTRRHLAQARRVMESEGFPAR
jgi:hypothetical protein